MSSLLSTRERAAYEEAARRRLNPRPVLRPTDEENGIFLPPPEPKPQIALKQFMTSGWHVLEPGTPFKDNWHIDAICEHLQALTSGDLQRLIINIPPRCEKSLLCAVFWFAWEWTFHPESRWMWSSYAYTLAARDSRKCRKLISSTWYQEQWGDQFFIRSSEGLKDTESRFENSRTGYRIATSVGGFGTGEGADRIGVDDPHNTEQAESDTERQRAVRWWLETMSTRANDAETAAFLIVMQRLHFADLSGEALGKDLGYEHLNLAMRRELTPVCKCPTCQQGETAIGFSDPRQEEGELLWPNRFPETAVKQLEKDLGSYAAAGQLQQHPAPRGGGMFKRADFGVVKVIPTGIKKLIRYWDTAATRSETSSYTVGLLMGQYKILGAELFRYLILDIRRGQWEPAPRNVIIKQVAEGDRRRWRGQVRIIIEQEPGGTGVESIQQLLNFLAGYSRRGDRVTGDKVLRAEPFANEVGAHNCDLLEADWNEEFLQEAENFPKGRKDQIDAGSGSYRFLTLPDDDEEDTYEPEMGKVRGWKG